MKKNFAALLFSLFAAAVFPFCGVESALAPSRISLKVDSFLVYPLFADFYFKRGDSLVFSPFEKDKIWLIANQNSSEYIEIDLKSREQTSFSKKFGHQVFAHETGAKHFWRDPFEPSVGWFSVGQSGVFRFDFSKKTGELLPLFGAEAFCLAFDRERVWLGSRQKGLFVFDRKMGRIAAVPNAPDGRLQSLKTVGDGRILAEYPKQAERGLQAFSFDAANGCWTREEPTFGSLQLADFYQKREAGGIAFLASHRTGQTFVADLNDQKKAVFPLENAPSNLLSEERIWANGPLFWVFGEQEPSIFFIDLPQKKLEKKVVLAPATGARFVGASASATEHWLASHDVWAFFDSKTGETRLVAPPVAGEPLILEADSRHVFAVVGRSLVVADRAFLMKKSESPSAGLFGKLARLDQLRDSLGLWSEEPMAARIEKIAFLERVFPAPREAVLDKHLAEFVRRGRLLFSAENSLFLLKIAEKWPEKARFTSSEWFDGLLREGRFAEAKSVVDAFAFLWSDEHKINSSRLTVEEAVSREDSLRRLRLAPDERLWATVMTIQNATQNFGYIGQTVDSLLRRLVERFSSSPRADDAAYLLILKDTEPESDCDSPRQNAQAAAAWRDFLARWPEADRRAEALAHLAFSSGETAAELRQSLEFLEEAKRLNPSLFNEETGNFAYFEREIRSDLDRLELVVSLRARHSKFRLGEPIELILEIKNVSNFEKEIPVWGRAGEPNLIGSVALAGGGEVCARPLRFENAAVFFAAEDQADGSIRLAAGASRVQKIDFSKKCLAENLGERPALGRYVFDQKGAFVFRGAWLGRREERLEVAFSIE